MPAKKDDWPKLSPMPEARAPVPFDRTYSPAEFERLKEGHLPLEMEDKWFAYYEAPWLFLHRSWSGFLVFQVRFEPCSEGARVAEVVVNRDPLQYKSTDAGEDALLLTALLATYSGRPAEACWDRYIKRLRERMRAGEVSPASPDHDGSPPSRSVNWWRRWLARAGVKPARPPKSRGMGKE